MLSHVSIFFRWYQLEVCTQKAADTMVLLSAVALKFPFAGAEPVPARRRELHEDTDWSGRTRTLTSGTLNTFGMNYNRVRNVFWDQ